MHPDGVGYFSKGTAAKGLIDMRGKPMTASILGLLWPMVCSRYWLEVHMA